MSVDYMESITSLVYSTPLWVQEAIFVDLKRRLEKKVSGITSINNEEDIYSVYIPKLTFKGKTELETGSHGFDYNVYKCLKNINENQRVVDITLNNFWTLEETSKHLAFCLENELIETPNSLIVYATIFYLGGSIRLGEYVKRIRKINVVELDEVLRQQKDINNTPGNPKKKIGEILIEMGYVANEDINKITHIKEEAKRRFIIQNNEKITAQSQNVNYIELIDKNNKLLQENNILKDKLRAIFNIQQKNKQQ
jgi:hypothetical protein